MTRLDEIRARLAAATPGPWHWYGNTKVHSLYLATVHGGRRCVMQFARWGMSSAQPCFQSAAHVMVDAKDLVTYEREYRKDVADINHPDAALIANAPTDIAFLLAEVERLTEEAAAERAAVVAWLRTGSDPRARGSSAWEESVGDVLREAATEIERGKHRRTP